MWLLILALGGLVGPMLVGIAFVAASPWIPYF